MFVLLWKKKLYLRRIWSVKKEVLPWQRTMQLVLAKEREWVITLRSMTAFSTITCSMAVHSCERMFNNIVELCLTRNRIFQSQKNCSSWVVNRIKKKMFCILVIVYLNSLVFLLNFFFIVVVYFMTCEVLLFKSRQFVVSFWPIQLHTHANAFLLFFFLIWTRKNIVVNCAISINLQPPHDITTGKLCRILKHKKVNKTKVILKNEKEKKTHNFRSIAKVLNITCATEK